MQTVYISRAAWGASAATEDFIRARFSVTPAEKTVIVVHHTATVDRLDHTPNRWTYPAAERYMRSLQTARPELGPLPYSMNLAVSEDLSTVWLFEGRGILRVGAHTAGFNRNGVGYGIFGNFDLNDPAAAVLAIIAIEQDVALRRADGLLNLGQEKNPRGWNAWGHRDTAAKSCPGNHLYPLLADFDLTPKGDDDDMSQALRLMVIEAAQKAWLPTQAAIDFWMTLPASDPQWRNDFEPAWSTWKQAEYLASKTAGPQGPAGPAGPRGLQGFQGSPGPQGAPGPGLTSGDELTVVVK